MGFGFLGMILVWGVVIGGVVLLVRYLAAGELGRKSSRRDRGALELLDDRYARGEIGREEFEQKKRDLEQ